MANGQALAAGSYSVRLADGSVNPAVGQTPEGMQWVEFVQSGQVKGRELATVVAGPEAKDVLKGKGPAPGGAVVHTLKGNDYMRVWINHSGKNYLIHLDDDAGVARFHFRPALGVCAAVRRAGRVRARQLHADCSPIRATRLQTALSRVHFRPIVIVPLKVVATMVAPPVPAVPRRDRLVRLRLRSSMPRPA